MLVGQSLKIKGFWVYYQVVEEYSLVVERLAEFGVIIAMAMATLLFRVLLSWDPQ